MSWFGALAGPGQGMAGEADILDRRNAAMELERQRAADRLELQRERERDRAEREQENIRLRAEVGGGGKGKGGINLFELAQQADTPEKQDRLVETVRAFQGDDAANVIARMYGKGDMERVTPTTGDFARFDRTLDEDGQSTAPVPEAVIQRARIDAEKGRIGLQRLLAIVKDPASYDDFAKGERTALGTDYVRNAGSDAEVRAAGGRVMALEGKDRFGVQGDQVVDKAGVDPTKQTPLGDAKAADERASARKHDADAKDKKEGGEDLKTLQQLRMSADARLKDARKALTEFDKATDWARRSPQKRTELAADRKLLEDEITRARGEFESISERLTKRLDRANADEDKPSGKGGAKPAKDEPVLPMPATKDKLEKGKVYQTSRGKARWNGSMFDPV